MPRIVLLGWGPSIARVPEGAVPLRGWFRCREGFACQPGITAHRTAATRAAPIMLRSMRSSLSEYFDTADFGAADFIVRGTWYCIGGAR